MSSHAELPRRIEQTLKGYLVAAIWQMRRWIYQVSWQIWYDKCPYPYSDHSTNIYFKSKFSSITSALQFGVLFTFCFVQNFSFHLAAQRNREVNKLVTSQNFDYKWLEQIYFLVCWLILFKLTSFWLLPTFAPSVQVLQPCFAGGQGRTRLLWQISPIIGAIKTF